MAKLFVEYYNVTREGFNDFAALLADDYEPQYGIPGSDCLTEISGGRYRLRFAVDSGELVEMLSAYDESGSGWLDSVVSAGGEEWRECERTGDWYPVSDLMETPDGEYINSDDWRDNYFTCCDCGEVYSQDYEQYSESRGESYCEDCYGDGEYGGVQYFTGTRKEFGRENSFGSSRSFGIELETNAGRCDTDFAFDGKSDGSIRGTEFVSHKLRGDDGMRELREFMDSGEGIETDTNCGVHIHINAADLDREELFAVYAAFCVCEESFAGKVSPHRMGANYARRFPHDGFARIVENYAAGAEFSRMVSNETCYQWMRGNAYNRHKTLENRLHHDSWNCDELTAWLILNLRFVRYARRLRIEDNETRQSFHAKAMRAFRFAESSETCLSAYLATEPDEPQRAFDFVAVA